MNEEIKVIEGKKVIEEILRNQARNQAVESIKRKRKRDERLAMLMAVLAVPVIYTVFWLIG